MIVVFDGFSVIELQWGHVFVDVEMEWLVVKTRDRNDKASMGPRLCRRGNKGQRS